MKPHKAQHLGKKAIKNSQYQKFETDPKAPTTKQKKRALTQPKKAKIARGRAAYNRSKKTSPGEEVTYQTEPDSIHVEGEKWNQVVQKQSLERTRGVERKINRKKKH